MDTPAFQHLLSLFPQLTLRQRRVAQQELTAPHAITSLNTSYRHAAGALIVTPMPPSWHLGDGVVDYVATVANSVCAPARC
ncbi:hypothetical protein WP2S18C03_18100 [Aeromonas veronii]|nr:hypothetical protein WP2S18C03_18100 [Aeromonas veronii]